MTLDKLIVPVVLTAGLAADAPTDLEDEWQRAARP